MKVSINRTKLMVSGTEGKTARSKINSFGKEVIADCIMCTKCRSWVYKKCTKRKKLSVALAQSFVCARRRRSVTAGTVEKKEKLYHVLKR